MLSTLNPRSLGACPTRLRVRRGHGNERSSLGLRLMLRRSPGAEWGCPLGAAAVTRAARRGATVTAADVSWPAVASARMNALLHRLPLRVLHGDFRARTVGRRFDLIVATPPVRTAPGVTVPSRGPQRAWDDGTS
ncbi:methyltransferase [Streptomyces sp. NPDC090036]|uniref:methyltransferase n=1 Tax=Streptomyces sp. NPDC090036 TaxID=3365926 RepID=UPI00381AEFAE